MWDKLEKAIEEQEIVLKHATLVVDHIEEEEDHAIRTVVYESAFEHVFILQSRFDKEKNEEQFKWMVMPNKVAKAFIEYKSGT